MQLPSAGLVPGAPTAATTGGPVRGAASGAMDEFLGIPYAAPPVGRPRWQPPAHSGGGRLPVMVWLYGGSLLVGESEDYNPAALVSHGNAGARDGR